MYWYSDKCIGTLPKMIMKFLYSKVIKNSHNLLFDSNTSYANKIL